MNIDRYTKEELCNALQFLTEEHKIMHQDIENAIQVRPASATKILTESMHALFCHKDHNTGACTWYQEDATDTAWEKPAHKVWLAYAVEARRLYGVDSTNITVVRTALASLRGLKDLMPHDGIYRLTLLSMREEIDAILQTVPNPVAVDSNRLAFAETE